MRADEQAGDKLTISTVAGASPKSYPLAPLPNNTSYDTISLQPEAQPNQPVSVPISFHGGLAFDHYDEETGGCLVNTGVLCNERNMLRAPVKVNTTTLTGAAAPVMYFFEESAPGATVAFDTGNASSNTETASATNSWSHTVAAGTDRIMCLGVCTPFGGAPSSVTFGSQALTLRAWLNDYDDTNTIFKYLLLAPTVGTDTITITFGGSQYSSAGVAVATGVDQAAPFGTTIDSAPTASGGPATVNAASATGELVWDVVLTGNVTATDDETQQLWNDIAGTDVRCASSYEAGAASVTTSWTLSGSTTWAILSTPLKPGLTPILYANSVEDGEVNIRKVSLNNANFGTLLNTKTWSGVTTKPMGRPAQWTSGGSTVWLQPLGDNILLDSLTTVAASTSNDTWSGGTDAYARHLTVVKNQLYRTGGPLSPDNEINILDYNVDPETDANWGGVWYVGDAGRKITDIGSVAGLTSIPKEDGIWEFDGVAEASNILPELGLAERNGQGLSFGRGGWFYPGATSLYWGLTGQPISPDSFDDEHTANDPSVGVGQYFKHGRWNGTVSYNGHFYSIYVNSLGTSAFIVWAYPVGDRWRWQAIATVTADFNDFHGIYVAETAKFSASEVRPCLFFANGNDLSYIWLDKNGAPMLRRGDIDLYTSATAISGRIDFGFPRVPKQLTYVSGWAEGFAAGLSHHQFQLRFYPDGETFVNIGTAITGNGSASPDGYFTKWWTQDSFDECRSLLFEALWTGTNSLTDQDGPHLRDVQIHAILKPAVTRQWSFLISAKDDTSRTAKTIRSNLEGYLNDLKKFKFPHEDAFSGMLTGLQLLRADEINELTPRGQTPPKYVFRATVREMPSS